MFGSTAYLVTLLFASIALLILLINWKTKLHPFLALLITAGLTALAAGEEIGKIPETLIAGAGDTLGETGVVVALGAMLGRLLADSGAIQRIANLVIDHSTPRAAPWIMTGVAFIIGIPMFFEVGLVVLIPVIYAVASQLEEKTGQKKLWYLRILVPAIAALACLHGMVPPHPGPLIAVSGLGANVGLTIGLGLVCAIPTVILAGPVYARWIAPRVKLEPSDDLIDQYTGQRTASHKTGVADRPLRTIPIWLAFLTVLVPVVLMLVHTVVQLVAPDSSFEPVAEVLGNPVIAMLAGVVFAAIALGWTSGMGGERIRSSFGESLKSIAGVILIIGGGGAFNEVLGDSGIGDAVVGATSHLEMNLVLLGWFIGILLSFATGSATVGITSATGIVAPLIGDHSAAYVSLVVIAIGSGSIGLNWVNHAGFWFVKESFGMTLGQATKTHMMVQTLVSVFGLIFAFLLSLFFI
ncbi:GntP family permease [Brevibacterium atlanticum]|uniref:GntP family permease n=1 Tax=Brevibacterium atlanticum TaxID=2697563 RepID=UPI00141DF374|nr:gluconate:H+ symporter [Brevibacterium atlanticum]